jgi:hypothetical protein
MLRKIALALLGLALGFGARADVKPGEPAPSALGSDLHGHALDVPALHGKVGCSASGPPGVATA